MHMAVTNFDTIKDFVQGEMKKRLPNNLYYHNIDHTFDDVLPAAIRLAGMEGVTGDEQMILKTAAVYHDAGFVLRYDGHEDAISSFLRQSLSVFGYEPKQVFMAERIILATRLQQVDGAMVQMPDPSDILQLIMCDADLDSLGREDFFTKSENLRRELAEYGNPFSQEEWYKKQLAFQEAHSYFTNSAKQLRDEGKQENIRKLRELVEQ